MHASDHPSSQEPSSQGFAPSQESASSQTTPVVHDDLRENEAAKATHPWKGRIQQAKVWVVLFLLGVLFRSVWSYSPSPAPDATTGSPKGSAVSTTWTCSMHPQFKLPQKGKCPICFMDLIPLQQGDVDGKDPREIKLSKAAMALMDIQTVVVRRRPLRMTIRMTGRIAYDETRIKTITAWVPGRLERMFVDYTGVRVRRGDHLVRLYSPELLATQQELLQALGTLQRVGGQDGILRQTAQGSLRSARQKLELMGLQAWQIKQIEQKRLPSTHINVYAPLGGIVIEKKALEGMYVTTGSPLYTIADLSHVWVLFDVYERDMPWIRVGQSVDFGTMASPEQRFRGRIVYIDPTLNPTTRTIRIRANIANLRGLLKPEMFVDGLLHVSLNAHGHARPPAPMGRWICPMHPEITSTRRIACSICGMALERQSADKLGHADRFDPLVIPNEAALLTGKRAIVYVRKPGKADGTFAGREVHLGPRTDTHSVVLEGLREGEEVVANGAFKLDSELQIQARPSMMHATKEAKEAKKTDAPPKPKERPTVSAALRKEQARLYGHYLALWRALAADKLDDSQKAAQALATLAKTPRPLRGAEAARWDSLRARLLDAFQRHAPKDIATLRQGFDLISKAVLQLQEEIGHKEPQAVYLAYCPMAFQDTGASWMQDQEAILNPYFGASMLRCGEIKRRMDAILPPKTKRGPKRGMR